MSKNSRCGLRATYNKSIEQKRECLCPAENNQDRITDQFLSDALKPNYTPSEELNQSILEKMKSIC